MGDNGGGGGGVLKGFKQCEICELTAEKRRGLTVPSAGAGSRLDQLN